MSDRIIDRISALQDEIGQGRRRIEKLEQALLDIASLSNSALDDVTVRHHALRIASASLEERWRR